MKEQKNIKGKKAITAQDIAESALVFDRNETANKVISKMVQNKKQEAMLVEKGDIFGAIFSRNLMKRKINSPGETKIDGFVEHIKPIPADLPIDDVVRSFLSNDYVSIPIQKDSEKLFVTKLRVLEALKTRNEIKGKVARDMMNQPYCVGTDDTIATSTSVIRETGVSRLPVINTDGSAAGLIDSLTLLNAFKEKSRMKLGEDIGEKASSGSALATSLMRKDIPRVEPQTPLKKVIEAMIDKKMATAIVIDRKKAAGIITPKPIFMLFMKKRKGTNVRLIGLRGESKFIKAVIEKEINNDVMRLGNFFPIDNLIIHVDKYHRTGTRKKYSVKARLLTRKGMFFADDHAWDITKAIKGVLGKLEREVMSKRGKEMIYPRN